jgi:hypothetical protein
LFASKKKEGKRMEKEGRTSRLPPHLPACTSRELDWYDRARGRSYRPAHYRSAFSLARARTRCCSRARRDRLGSARRGVTVLLKEIKLGLSPLTFRLIFVRSGTDTSPVHVLDDA